MFSTRKALLAVLVAAALITSLSSPSFADKKDDLKKQQKELSRKAKEAQKDLDQSTAKYDAAIKALKAAQAKLDAAQATLDKTKGELAVAETQDQQMQAKLVQTEAELDAAVAKLEKGEAELARSEAVVEQFTVENLQQGDRGMRAFSDLLRGEDPSTFSQQMSINESVSDAQLATMQQLEATKVMLQINRDNVQKLRDQVAEQRRQAAANLVQKQKLESAAADQATAVTQLVGQRSAAKSAAAKAKAEDEKRLREIEAARKKTERDLAALVAKDLASGGAGVGGDGGGMLSYPVHGPITSPYGMRWHPITHVYKLHDGTDFGVPCGTPVKAAASGTIISQYYNGAYGNRVILNNGIMRGKSVVTTYNHLSRFRYSVGTKVKRGQVIAYSGTTGYSTGCHLHFMVLVNGRTTQPMNWL